MAKCDLAHCWRVGIYSKQNVQGGAKHTNFVLEKFTLPQDDLIACYKTMDFIGIITAKKNSRNKVSKIGELYLMHTGQH